MVCRKLYCFFVSAEPDEDVVGTLAAHFVQHDFELAPVVVLLIASDHFYADTLSGSRIKSPLELLTGFLREAELVPTTEMLEDLRIRLAKLNQEVLNPPNVAGWPGLSGVGLDAPTAHADIPQPLSQWVDSTFSGPTWDWSDAAHSVVASPAQSYVPDDAARAVDHAARRKAYHAARVDPRILIFPEGIVDSRMVLRPPDQVDPQMIVPDMTDRR